VKKFFLILTLLLCAAIAGAGLFFLAWLFHWNAWIAALGPIIFLFLPALYYLLTKFLAWREKKIYAKNVLSQEPVMTHLLEACPLKERFSLFAESLGPAGRANLNSRPWALWLTDAAIEEGATFSLVEEMIVISAPILASDNHLGAFLAGKPVTKIILPISLGLLTQDAQLSQKASQARTRIQELYQALDRQIPVHITLTPEEGIATDTAGSPNWPALSPALTGQSLACLLNADPQSAALSFQRKLRGLLEWLFFQRLALQEPVEPILKALAPWDPKPLARFLGLLSQKALGPLPGPKVFSLSILGPGLGSQELKAKTLKTVDSLGEAKPIALKLPGTPRQKRLKLAFGAYYAALLILSLTFWLNVRHNRAMTAIPEPNMALAAETTAAGLDAAYGQSRFVERLRLAQKAAWPGLGPDRGLRRLDSAREKFLLGFQKLAQDLELALSEQVNSEKSPIRFVALRQLLWLAGAYRLALGSEWPELDKHLAGFPAWPADLSGPSQPFWNLVYSELLVNYLKLKPPKQESLQDLERLELLILKAIPEREGLDWLMEWANSLPDSQTINLATGLTGGALSRVASRGSLAEIPPAYALKGRTAIMAAMSQLASARFGPSSFNEKIQDFQNSYDRDYLAQWRAFGLAAANLALMTPAETRPIVDNALKLMSENLGPFLEKELAPPFARNLELETLQNIVHRRIRRAKSPASGGVAGLLEKADYLAEDVLGLREALDPNQYRDSDLIGRIMGASQPYKDYHLALGLIDQTIQGQPTQAMNWARAHFGGAAYGDPSQSPFTQAERALERYLAFFHESADSQPDPIRALVEARLKTQKTRLIRETAKTLDRLWADEVLAPTRFLAEAEARVALFSPNGLLDKFLADRAAPFLAQKGQIYQNAAWQNQAFLFNEDFLKLLSVGRLAMAPLEPIKDAYPVKLTALFVTANPEAKEKPQKATISLKAPSGAAVLENFNYPTSQIFNFQPGVSGDVEVAIVFPTITLTLAYEGQDAFAYFLNDILSGELILTRTDFPQDSETLSQIGVDQIRLAIQTEGGTPLLRFVEMAEAPKPPNSIIQAETDL
jgi:hypothetical protein